MDMKRLVAMVVAAGAAMAAVAMPTKAELQKAQTMVKDVTAADVAALKAKTKTPAEVAAKHMELAGQTGSEAEKYLLLQGAFKLYAKAGDYDAAANVIEKLQTEITDYDPEVTVELCGAEFIRKMRENAPRLYALKENARRIVFYRKQRPIREAAVKKNPKDAQAQRKLAECHAELGDWPKALEVFVKAGGEFKKMAEGETSGKVPAQELGDFWWDYETKSDTAVYKLHAAELYRKALADNSFKGLVRTRAEQRVKEVAEVAVDLPKMSVGKADDSNPMLVHRWSFNKDFVDSVGKVEAKKLGRSVKLENGQCVVRKGGLDLGETLRKVGIPFTVEFWYAELGKEEDGFIFRTDGLKIRGQESNYGVQWENYGTQHDFARLQANHRVYFAVTYDGRQVTAYVCDMDGDKRLNKLSKESASIPFDGENLFLGGCAREENKCPSGKYDEIRIWKTALSMDDIEKSCKAGPDNVPAVTVAKSTGDEDGDYICFVSSSKADWSVSDTEPDEKWFGLGFHDVLQWKVVHGAYRTDKKNTTKWLRTKADWGFDPKMIEKAEIEYVADDRAMVWLNGKELADLGYSATPRNRDVTASFVKAISVGRNVLAVKFTNNGGKGVCDIGIRVKLYKKPFASNKEDSGDSWSWVIPVEAQASVNWWRMTDVKPPAHWLFRNQCPGWQDWPEVTSCAIDKENTCRWLRAAVEWKGDPQKVEKAELVYLVDDSATVWIGGIEAAKVGLASQKYASKDITSVFKSTIGKGEWVAVCVEVRNSKGSGYGDFGIRVKMRK